MDALPIRSPAFGFAQQTPWVVVRFFLIAWSMAFMIATQIHQSSPTLPFPTARRLLIPTVESAITTVLFIVLSWTVAFPFPFPFQVLAPGGSGVFLCLLWDTWKQALAADPEARHKLYRCLPVFAVQMTILVAYPVFNVAFTSASKQAQPFVSLGLPMMKLVFKNLMSKGVFHMEDLAPATIVFNIDVFHAVYVSSTMQQAQTSGATIVIMIIDIVQSIIAYYEVHQVQQRVIRLARECNALDRESAATTQAALQRGLLPYALHIVETCPDVRNHPEVVLPRHLQCHARPWRFSDRCRRPSTARLVQVAPSTQATTHVASPEMTDPMPAQTLTKLTDIELLRLESVKCVLKLLHMIEFYVLIEFAEMLVVILYTLYMLAITHMPNRIYYKQLAPLSPSEIDSRTRQLAVYASLELLSFVMFCTILDRKVRSSSTIQLLAFVLQKNALVVHSTLFMWVFYVLQISFEHFGADYTFRFTWHHKRLP